jgi:hypothetical protein
VPGALSEGADGVLTPSPFLKTSGGWIHTLQLKKEGSEWEILKWIPSGMGDSPRWYYPKEKASNTVNYEIISNNKFTSKATATTYNRTNAVNYAIAHWNNPDSRYPDYSVAPYNGDCTNFVSQCLEAGGWTQTSKVNGRASVLSWYHDQGYTSAPSVEKRSTSWTEAKSLNAFFMNSSRVVQASYLPTSLALGDIIQLKNNTSGIHHSMIVTSKPIINNVQHVRVTFRNGGGYQPKTDYDIDNFTDTKLTIKIANSY